VEGDAGRGVGVDAVFDIETEAWSTYVLGGVLTAKGEYFETRDPEALASRILQIEGDVWAHNGGRYDALWLLSVLDSWGTPWRAHLAGARITLLEVGWTRIRDSYALVPMSLAKGAALGGVRKSKTGFVCACGRACGGYCRIRRSMSTQDFKRLSGYLEHDCRATLAMLRAVAGWLDGEDHPMRGTIGSTAWVGARGMLDLPCAKWTGEGYQLSREGYYGGRVEVYQPIAGRVWMYDRRASYPAALVETPVPVGKVTCLGATRAGRVYRAGWPGIYRAEVKVAECAYPPLPLRLSTGLAYPWGTFSGVWTSLELREAERRGARILRIDYCAAWRSAERALAPWCERIWQLRAKSEPVWAAWIKLLANSLTGKLAQRPEHRIIVGGAKLHSAPWEPLGPSLRIWTRPAWRIPACGHVHWAAYLTASARADLLKQIEAAGSTALYCDTDSCYSAAPQSRRIGDGLGEWKLEGIEAAWRAWAPKLYAAGEKIAAKGMPGLDVGGLTRVALGAPHVSEEGVSGLRSAARGGGNLFRRQRLVRISHADGEHFGSRILGSDGRTRARSYTDLTGDSLVESLEAGETDE